MIGSLRGTIVHRSARGEVLLEVGGVGYRVTVPPATMAHLGELGATALVHTHLARPGGRPHPLRLRHPRRARLLRGPHRRPRGGAGPRPRHPVGARARRRCARPWPTATSTPSCLVPGVGRKTAARLLIELKSRLDLPDDDLEAAVAANGNGHGHGNGSVSTRAEVRAALAALGYEADEIARRPARPARRRRRRGPPPRRPPPPGARR